MKKLFVFALTFVVAGTCMSAEVANGIVAPYLHIQMALAHDSTDGLAEAARTIAAEAEQLGDDAIMIGATAQAIAAATDITTARAAFGPLSDALITYGEEVGFGDLKVAYCPMADKSWVQKEGSIRNPFYGASMLTCGVFTK